MENYSKTEKQKIKIFSLALKTFFFNKQQKSLNNYEIIFIMFNEFVLEAEKVDRIVFHLNFLMET